MSASSLPLPQGKSVSLKQFVSRHINEIGLLVVIAILYLVFSLNAPGFISLNNQMNVLRDAATIGIAADVPRQRTVAVDAVDAIESEVSPAEPEVTGLRWRDAELVHRSGVHTPRAS